MWPAFSAAMSMPLPPRTFSHETVESLGSNSRVPVINAGDGVGEHPTQALLDTFTIREELGRSDNLNVTMLGDLKYGRTVHSLARLLTLFSGITLNYVSPDVLRMPQDVMEEVGAKGIPQTVSSTLKKVLPKTDVLYVTRVQKERFEDALNKLEKIASKLEEGNISLEESLKLHTAERAAQHELIQAIKREVREMRDDLEKAKAAVKAIG
jgi:exodeoxyribonuclease VII small subunit